MNRRKYYNETIEKRKKIVSESMFSKVTKRAFRDFNIANTGHACRPTIGM